ncbi:MAG: hypothetical protein MJZ20_02190 [Bacteroidaceae bacterium]|nr:hypothetical protein [Bacteroidaceae bacterium]
MEENYFATSRNGHELKDMYNPETNTLDIRSNGLYPSNVLSNLCSNRFVFDGMICGSMEGFLQSLKQKDLDKQRQICSMKGGNARKKSVTSWQTDQILWWKGREINRQSDEFRLLVEEAYEEMFFQNERFRTALMQTRGMKLAHTTGEENPYKTILTPAELCGILEQMRDTYDQQLTAELKHVVNEIGIGQYEGARGRWFTVCPTTLIERKLVVRTDVGLEYMENIRNNIEKHTTGLTLERVTELNDNEFELVLNSLPLSGDVGDLYILATDFSGEFNIRFFSEDNLGVRKLIGTYDFIDK